MNLLEQMEQDEKDLDKPKGDSNYFSFESGTTSRIRILSTMKVIGYHFFGEGQKPHTCYGINRGCPLHEVNEKGEEPKLSTKYVGFVLDRSDEKVKLAELPFTVFKEIAKLQQDDDFAFSNFPMPYDIKITYNKKLSPNEMYKVIASPKMEPVSAEVLTSLEKKMSLKTPDMYVEDKKMAQITIDKQKGTWISPDELQKRIDDKKKAMAHDSEPEEVIDYGDGEHDPADVGNGQF